MDVHRLLPHHPIITGGRGGRIGDGKTPVPIRQVGGDRPPVDGRGQVCGPKQYIWVIRCAAQLHGQLVAIAAVGAVSQEVLRRHKHGQLSQAAGHAAEVIRYHHKINSKVVGRNRRQG